MPSVSQREFYAALTAIWAYLVIVIGETMMTDRGWYHVVIFVAAFAATISYSVKAARGARQPRPDQTG